MKKTLITAVLIVASLTLGGCGGGNQTNQAPSAETKTETREETVGEKQSISQLINKGGSVECSYKAEGMEGKILVSGNKFYQEIDLKTEEMSKTLAISDGQWLYLWNPEQKEAGMKLEMAKMIEQAGETASLPQETNETVDINKEMEMDCKPWQPDESKFKTPSDVTFNDLSGAMGEIQKQMQDPENKQSMCGMCDMAADEESKVECRAGLGCE